GGDVLPGLTQRREGRLLDVVETPATAVRGVSGPHESQELGLLAVGEVPLGVVPLVVLADADLPVALSDGHATGREEVDRPPVPALERDGRLGDVLTSERLEDMPGAVRDEAVELVVEDRLGEGPGRKGGEAVPLV